MHMRDLITAALLISLPLLCGCGGGSSGSGMLIEGTLTEGGGVEHDRRLVLKHDAGERIENVEICALGECSITDDLGQWGFVADESFTGGEVTFSIKGHGIDGTTLVTIPVGAEEIFIDFQHLEDGSVVAEHVTADGETSHNEDEEHQHDE